MTDTLEHPAVKDNSLDSFIEAASKADRGEAFELPSAEKTENRAPVTPEPTESTSSPDTTPESKPDDRPRDSQGRFTKREDGTDIPESERKPVQPESPKPSGDVAPAGDAQTDKPESEYVKAKKDLERLNRNRQEFEEEKRREREAIQAERQRLEDEKRQIQQWQQSARGTEHQRNTGQPQFSSQDYVNFAEQCRQKATQLRTAGDYEAADEQADLAINATKKAFEVRELEENARFEQSAYQHEQIWNQNLVKAMEAEPEIASVMKGGEPTPLAQEVTKVFEESERRGGILNRIPEGGALAIEFAKLRLQAGAASGLDTRVKQLEEENRTLKSKLSLGGGGPTSPAPAKKSFDQMPASEAMQEIERLAAQAA